MRKLYRYEIRRVSTDACVREGNVASSVDAAATFRDYLGSLDREVFLAIALNGRNKAVGFNLVSIGSLGASIVHPREAFKYLVMANAAAVVFVHNHPSGDPSPSAEDRRITERLRRAGEVLGIEVLDHVIVGEGSHYSFADNGW